MPGAMYAKVAGAWAQVFPAVSSIPVMTGGVVEQDGEWTVHTFADSGDLVVTQGGECEWFLIAGGGAGGWGGGGAGGVIPPKTVTLAPGTYPVVIGDGGPSVASNVQAAKGQDSTFNGETAVGGGYGAKQPATTNGGDGGSGGGANGGTGGAGTPGQGNKGGDGFLMQGGGAGGPALPGDSYGVGGLGIDIWGTMYASGGTAGISDMAGAPETQVPQPGGGGRGAKGPTAQGGHGVDGTGGGGGGGGVNGSWSAFGPCGKGGKGIFKIRYRSA